MRTICPCGGSPAVGDGDVSVHRHRGFDASLGGRLRRRCGPRWRLHDEVLRSAIEAHGGWLFKHTGDGVCAAFGSARGAVDAAVEAQRRLALPVRMGIATGEAERRGDDYFGPVLNRTARVMAAGHGGQILVAASTAAVVRRRRPGRPGRAPAAGPVGCRAPVPGARRRAWRASSRRCGRWTRCRGTCRCRSTSFVGRDVEVKELADVVRAHRLVTLTGVGGVGKTRLAVQVAAELAARVPRRRVAGRVGAGRRPGRGARRGRHRAWVSPRRPGLTVTDSIAAGAVGTAPADRVGQLRARAGRGRRRSSRRSWPARRR